MTSDRVSPQQLHIGWASADITPDRPVHLAGQHYARISEGVRDPVTATALALVSGRDISNAVILIGCDLVSIADSLRDAARARAAAALPEIDSANIILNATHTHTAPLARTGEDARRRCVGNLVTDEEPDLGAMDPADYIAWAAERIAGAAIAAWKSRAPGAMGYGLGAAVVGRNRRIVYENGVSRMYGPTAREDFSHVEGHEDHDLNLMATWDAAGGLTGLVVNLACPSQVTENLFEISADYWHETRLELRRRMGERLFVLPQCSAAGDQSPRNLWNKTAEERMLRLTGRTARQQIAVRIADAAAAVLPHIEADRQSAPILLHRAANVPLPRRRLSEDDVRAAMKEAEPHRLEYERLKRELEAHPELRAEPRWYVPITRAFRKWRWSANVKSRFESALADPFFAFEIHVLRIGDIAVATNPFEYYLDFGVRIKARSPATQTFVVQLAGGGTYVPTERAEAGKGYGAVPASAAIGPEGGRQLVETTLKILDEFWAVRPE